MNQAQIDGVVVTVCWHKVAFAVLVNPGNMTREVKPAILYTDPKFVGLDAWKIT